jgi:PAT family acetyl-CoA transporter-like MFS transporter 1
MNIVILTLLYIFQGVPLGMAYGTLTFLLKKHLSYTELGIFALSAYPFSLKFFWSPIVDTKYISWIGRRKTWICSLGMLSGMLMYAISPYVEAMTNSENDIWHLTGVVFCLIFLFAT